MLAEEVVVVHGETPFPEEAVDAAEEVADAGTAAEDAYVAVVRAACGAAEAPAAVVGVAVGGVVGGVAAAAAVVEEILRTSFLPKERAGIRKWGEKKRKSVV